MRNLRKTFSKIYDNYVDKIYRFIFVKVSSQEIAQDLTSETFLRYWKKLQKSNEKIDNEQAFLYKIARNLVTDHYREKGKVNIVSAEYASIIDPSLNLEEKSFISSDMEVVRTALANINEDYQTALIYYYLDELSIPEIAEIMDKSEGNVRVVVHRGLKALKKEIESKHKEV